MLNRNLRFAGSHLVAAMGSDRLQHMAVVAKDLSCQDPLILLPDPLCVEIICNRHRLGSVIDMRRAIKTSGVDCPEMLLNSVNTRAKYLLDTIEEPNLRIAAAYDYPTNGDGIIIGPLKPGAYDELINGMITHSLHS